METTSTLKQLLNSISTRTKTIFIGWLLINIGFFLISGGLTGWDYRVIMQGEEFQFGLFKGQDSTPELFSVKSTNAFFPFPEDCSVYLNYETGSGYFGHIKAFRVSSYDWTELIVYTIIPLLIILAGAWLKIKGEQRNE